MSKLPSTIIDSCELLLKIIPPFEGDLSCLMTTKKHSYAEIVLLPLIQERPIPFSLQMTG